MDQHLCDYVQAAVFDFGTTYKLGKDADWCHSTWMFQNLQVLLILLTGFAEKKDARLAFNSE